MAIDSAALCRRNCWIVAAAFGALVAVMLAAFAGHGFLKALLIGLVLGLAMGLFLHWAFCGRSAPAVQTAAEVDPSPLKGRPFADEAPVQDEPAARFVAPPPPPTPAEPAPRPAPASVAPVPERPRASAPVTSDTAFGLNAALAKSKDEPVAAPEMLSAPRGGKPDDLKQIKGIGPKLEKLLNDVGVWHFDQIASWKARDIAFVDEKMVGFHGRITRDEWVKQARLLAKGGETEFSARVKKGEVY